MARSLQQRSTIERGPVGSTLLAWLTSRSPPAMAAAVLGVIALGTVGYMIVGGVGFIEALYLAVITVSTVGYTNTVETDAGRLFSTIYIVIGVGVVSLTISSLAAALVAGRVKEVFGRRRMEKQISTLKGHLILCGYGRIGRTTGRQIYSKGVALVVVDTDPVRIEEAIEDGMLGVRHDATEEEALEMAGIASADALLCCLPSDAENVYAILNAREICDDDLRVVAFSRVPGSERKLLRAGANHVVSPYVIGARHMARQILSPHLARVMSMASGEGDGLEQVGVQLDEFPIAAGSMLAGLSLKESPIRRDYGVMLVAVIDPDGTQHFNPGPDLVMHEDSVLVSVGPPEGLRKLSVAAGSSRHTTDT